MPEPDCFLRYRIGYGTFLQPCLGCQRAALLRGILRRENHSTYTYWRRAARASRGFKMVLFTEPSEDLCRRQVRSTECPSSFNFLPIKLQFIVRTAKFVQSFTASVNNTLCLLFECQALNQLTAEVHFKRLTLRL